MSHTIKELQEMSDEQIVTEHDRLAQETSIGIKYFLHEVERRAQNRQTEAMLLYARRMSKLTVLITILTVVNVIAVLVPLCR